MDCSDGSVRALLFEGGNGHLPVDFIGIPGIEFHDPLEVKEAFFVHGGEADGCFVFSHPQDLGFKINLYFISQTNPDIAENIFLEKGVGDAEDSGEAQIDRFHLLFDFSAPDDHLKLNGNSGPLSPLVVHGLPPEYPF
jgi:hypothetical protein